MILTVYFHGPASNWANKVAPGEIVARQELATSWLCRWKAKRIMRELNTGRCGYVIQDGDSVLEHVKAENQVLA